MGQQRWEEDQLTADSRPPRPRIGCFDHYRGGDDDDGDDDDDDLHLLR